MTLSRRELLGRVGAGLAAGWTAPVIVGSVTPAAAMSCTRAFSLTIGTNASKDRPRFLLTNSSTCIVQITSLQITTGDNRFNFDQADFHSESGGVAETLLAPDTQNNALRSTTISYTFAGFDPGDSFSFRAELDPDPSIDPNGNNNHLIYNLPGPVTPQIAGSSYDADGWQIVFWNNNDGVGPGTNMQIDVGFSDGSSVTMTVPDMALVNSIPGTSTYSSSPNIVVTGSV